MSVDIDHRIDEELRGEGGVLATLSEEQQNIVQMQEIAERTIEPGLMRLPVSEVTTAENSENWVIEVEHPVLGEIRFYKEKPIHGWDGTHGIVELMDWYGITSRDPYYLQCEDVYVEYQGEGNTDIGDWEIVPPPGSEPRVPLRERALSRVREEMPERNAFHAWLWLMAMSTIGGFSGSIVVELGIGESVIVALVSLLIYVFGSITALMLFTEVE